MSFLKRCRPVLISAMGLLFLVPESFGAESSVPAIRIGITAAPLGKGNPFVGTSEPSIYTWSALFDALTVYKDESEPKPSLALKWTQTGPLSWRFNLRAGVRFQNGEVFNADAVKATFDYLQTQEGRATTIGREVGMINTVEVIDDLTIDFTTHQPDLLLPGRLALISIVAPQAWSDLGPAGFGETPAGTGPYILESWGVANSQIKLRPWSGSFRAAEGMLPVELLPISDIGARVAALRSRNVDIVLGLSPDDWLYLESDEFERVVDIQPQIMSIAFRNVGNPDSPTQSRQVRQAMNLAIDRKQFAEALYQDLAEPASQGTIAGVNGYNPDLAPFEYDPDAARSLIKEAGYPDGFDIVIEVFQSTTSSLSEYQFVAQSLEQVGIRVELRLLAFAEWLRKYNTSEWGDADAFSMVWNTQAVRDALRPIEYFSCLKPVPFFCERDIVPKITNIAMELDPIERTKNLQKLQADLREISPAILLMPKVHIIAFNDQIQAVPVSNGVIRYSGLRLR